MGNEDSEPGAESAAPPPGVPAGPSDLEGEDDSFTAPLSVPSGTLLPSFANVGIGDVQLWLRRSGAPFVLVEVYDPAEAGRVIDQLPAPGTTLDSGTAVTVVVSRGPAPTAPPPADAGDGTGPSDAAQSDAGTE